MVVLYCPCPERHRLWGELWWVEGQHRWVFPLTRGHLSPIMCSKERGLHKMAALGSLHSPCVEAPALSIVSRRCLHLVPENC